jgi:hypothetical protein
VLLSLLFIEPSRSTPLLDHSYNACGGRGGNVFAFLGNQGEAFEVGITGYLTGFDLYLSRGLSPVTTNGFITWELRRTLLDYPWLTPAGLLASGSTSSIILPRPSAFVHFQISNSPFVRAGEELAFVLRGSNTPASWVGDNSGCGNGGFGYAFSLQTGDVYIFPGVELGLQTYIEPFPPISQPLLTCPEARNLECGDSFATFTSTVSDPSGSDVEVIWSLDGTPYQTNLVAGAPGVTNHLSFSNTFSLGEHVITVSASNKKTDPVTCSTPVIVRDTTPPDLTRLVASPDVLWPPNDRMVKVSIMLDASDGCGPTTCAIVKVAVLDTSSNIAQPAKPGDWALDGDFLQLRAARSPSGGARVYIITIECSDLSGNKVHRATTVTVPHDQRK